eukprot:scaffold888_cov61-Phaeocystis_antarctica.AAC.5
MATAFATTARPRRFLRRVWPAIYTNAEEREERGGEGGRHAGNVGWDWNGNAPTTGAVAAMVGRSMASQGQWKRSPQKPQAVDHRRRTERGRDGVGRGSVDPYFSRRIERLCECCRRRLLYFIMNRLAKRRHSPRRFTCTCKCACTIMCACACAFKTNVYRGRPPAPWP